MPHYEKHVFICTNERDKDNPKGDCAHRGSDDIRDAFKKGIHERGLKGRMRANAAGCLDQCAYGPTVVVYPEQVWYSVPTRADAEEIIEKHLVGGVPVERLLLRTNKDKEQDKVGKEGKEPK